MPIAIHAVLHGTGTLSQRLLWAKFSLMITTRIDMITLCLFSFFSFLVVLRSFVAMIALPPPPLPLHDFASFQRFFCELHFSALMKLGCFFSQRFRG
jgi:hypothetical protein